ncbi:MAG: ATP-binding protein, partial [Candidatus Margulisbacteria bacterium]|nr:ATP-binding protein [Candidatus Margulisiibacteriota bacterium]
KQVKERSEELTRVQMELERAQRLSDIGTLSATVAHELRNPLGVIRTANYNLRRKNTNQDLIKHFDNIDKKVLESDQIINNLLNYARIKTPNFEKTDLSLLIRECIENIVKRHVDEPLKIKTDLKEIKNLIINIDPVQIAEVFINILNNSSQAIVGNTGEINIKAVLLSNKKVAITIADNGPGIPSEDLGRIFEPFFTRKSKGTGLGLTICKELVHLHNGEIMVESQKNIGTKFTIILPTK